MSYDEYLLESIDWEFKRAEILNKFFDGLFVNEKGESVPMFTEQEKQS